MMGGCVDRVTDRWMNRWMGGWMEGWMDEWMDGRMEPCVNSLKRRIHAKHGPLRMDGWMDG